MDPFLGEIRPFAFGIVPKGWAQCNGQILQISQYQALFALLSTTYGGNGTSTFALPDLRSRTPLHAGTGSSDGQPYPLGQQGGAETVALAAANLPAHAHAMQASTGAGNNVNPVGSVPATASAAPNTGGATIPIYAAPGAQSLVTLAADTLGNTGTGAGHPNIQPVLALNYCIALTGIYPPRN